ncbi:uncharacterized protein P884DRAFT_255577 [Thermothelomyces heterothallicus CBS 202.75]|uniref:uncharacterized protein n=1 Tax=Thermothelomyces heterothallicus CBS 202.75 TaxID=1149848 RepID=UPI00374408CD
MMIAIENPKVSSLPLFPLFLPFYPFSGSFPFFVQNDQGAIILCRSLSNGSQSELRAIRQEIQPRTYNVITAPLVLGFRLLFFTIHL